VSDTIAPVFKDQASPFPLPEMGQFQGNPAHHRPRQTIRLLKIRQRPFRLFFLCLLALERIKQQSLRGQDRCGVWHQNLRIPKIKNQEEIESRWPKKAITLPPFTQEESTRNR